LNNPIFKSPYIAFSAPSGTGKTTIVELMVSKYPNMVISISATTRPIRPNEKEDISYHFMTKKNFEKAITRNEFLEFEEVHGCYYGTLKKTVEDHVSTGKTVLFDIDVNGALAIKKAFPKAILIFLKPPNPDELVNRLKNRKSETDQSIKERLQRLEYEYEKGELFDFVVVNDQLDDTIKTIEKIITDKKS
jgi:guanylate kinase